MKRLALILALLMTAIPAAAQTTVVSSTGVLDSVGVPYASGTFTITLVNTTGQTPYFQGAPLPISQQKFVGSLSTTAAFSVTIPSNAFILAGANGPPSLMSWNFAICAEFSVGCFNTNIVISGSTQDITATLNAISPRITFTVQGIPPGPGGGCIQAVGVVQQWVPSCGAGASYYQSLANNGSNLPQEPKLNLISGSNATVSCVDNSGATRTDCTVSASITSTGWSTLTSGTNSNGGTFAASGNAWDFSAATSFKVPTAGLLFPGTSSGAITISPTASATATISLPTSGGTFAVSATSPLVLNSAGNLSCPTCGTTGGSVTSVGLTQTGTVFTISGSPVTSSGNINLSFASQSANQVLASPNGASGALSVRSLVGADIPAVNLGASGNGGVTGTLLASALPATAVQTTQSNTYTAGTQNLSNAAGLVVPVSSSAAPTTSGSIAYNSSINRYVIAVGGATMVLPWVQSGVPVSGDVATWTGTSGQLADTPIGNIAANRNLSNLVAPTALNVDLLCASSGSCNLGNSTTPMSTVNATTINAVGSGPGNVTGKEGAVSTAPCQAGQDSIGLGDSTTHLPLECSNGGPLIPLRPVELSTCTMASGTCTVTWSPTFTVAPACFAQWNGTGTLTGIVKAVATTSQCVVTSSVNTDTGVFVVSGMANPN